MIDHPPILIDIDGIIFATIFFRNNKNNKLIDNMYIFTIICCVIILIAFLAAWKYVASTDSVNFSERKKWIDQLPSLISTLGVLGTFFGITIGLYFFDTSNLDRSIPLLLEGLKTAFYTSLLGMIFSLVLNRVVSHKFDVVERGGELQRAAQLIVDVLENNQKELPSILSENAADVAGAFSQSDAMQSIKTDLEQLKDDLEEIKGHIQEMKAQSAALADIPTELSRLSAVALTATASLSTIDNNVDELSKR